MFRAVAVAIQHYCSQLTIDGHEVLMREAMESTG